MADPVSDIFALPRDQFDGLLNELEGAGRDTSDLLRQYRRENSIFSGLYDWADSTQEDLASEGRRGVGGGLLSKDIGATGSDAVGSMRLEPGAFVSGLLGSAGQALDAPAAAALGDMLPQDMIGEALNTASIAQLGGAAMTAPSGALRSGLARNQVRLDANEGGADINLADGSNVGRIDYIESDGAVRVLRSDVAPEFQGMGYGTDAYRALVDDTLDRGLLFQSDSTLLPGGRDMYSRLARDGYVMNESPNVRMAYPGNQTTMPRYNPDDPNRVSMERSNSVEYRQSIDPVMTISGRTPQSPAQEVSGLLRNNRAADVTDDMMAAVDPQEMFRLYESGATGVDMPMDAASRAARAEGMGFDTGTPLYHGTGADIQAFDNARTGTNDAGLWGRGHYLSTSPRTSSSYAMREDNPSMIPAVARIENPLQLTTGSDLVTRMPDGRNTRDLIGPNLDGARIKEIALGNGSDSVTQVKPNGSIGDVVTFDPSNIRSQFARFDPRLSHLSNLNAANASPMTGLLAAPVAQETQELPFQKFLRGLFQ